MADDTTPTPIRLVLVDDHRIVLSGLRYLLELEPDFTVVAECSSGSEALDTIRGLQPDIVLLDLLIPGFNGLDVLRALSLDTESPQVILLTAALSEDDMIAAVRLGVRGVILKEMAPQQLVHCVRHVHAGGTWLEKNVVAQALRKLVNDPGKSTLHGGLTPRELEIVRWVAQGMRNKEIARQVGIAEGTVKQHMHNIYEKLGVQGRVNLVRYAQEQGLLYSRLP